MRALLLYCLLSLVYISNAQLVDPKKINYDREISLGINMNTLGGLLAGINLRYIKKQNYRDWLNLSLDIVNTKHPKEIRVASATGSSFIYGKVNYLFSIRPQIGLERRLFRKDQQDGIRVHWVIAGGPTLGLLKPYYIEYLTEEKIGDTTYLVSENVAYDPQVHSSSQIAGPGGFFYGFDEMKAVLGINAKIGLNFEFGLFDERVTGLEVGFVGEAFTRNLQIHEVQQRQQFFGAVYLNLYFGTKFPESTSNKLNTY